MRHPAAASRVYAVPALEKGLDLLELLAAERAPQAQTEVARKLGRSPSEIFRMLVCLERRGYIAKEEGSGRYRPTLRLFELAHTQSPVEELLRAAARPMRDAARELRESCHLSVLSRGKLVVLAEVESPERVRFSVEVGARHPVASTCSGRLLLAHLAKDELDGLLAADPEVRALGPAGRRRFLLQLLSIRREGCSVIESEHFHGVRDVAVLAGSPRAGLAAALCVPALKVRGRWPSVAAVRRVLERAARGIERTLGLSKR
jgi:DNA-binding IclR family transcriptional regulator